MQDREKGAIRAGRGAVTRLTEPSITEPSPDNPDRFGQSGSLDRINLKVWFFKAGEAGGGDV